MADLMTQQVSAPNWWQTETSATLGASIEQALHTQAQRERWKYTKPSRVLSLVNPGAEPIGLPSCVVTSTGAITSTIVSHDQPLNAAPELQAADFGEVLNDAPEALAALCGAPAIQLLTVTQEANNKILLNHQRTSMPLFIKVAADTTLHIEETMAEDAVDHLHCIWLQLNSGSRVVHARNTLGGSTINNNAPALFRHLQADIGRDANYTLQNHSVGTTLHRQNIHLRCNAPGAHAELSSAAYIPQGAHLDQQVTVQHTAANSTSQQTVHNIAANKASVTFNGRIHIHPASQGVQAHLTNKNLGLGDQATINTKPELEIYTDDVQCSHGATVGRLDDNHLFYFASRGIPLDAARKLLSSAFLKVCTQGALAEAALDTFTKLFQREQ